MSSEEANENAEAKVTVPDGEVLFRQIHPTFFQKEEPTSQSIIQM